jgi:hypothetical protein
MSPADMQKAVEMFRNGDESLEQFLKDHGITNIYKWKYNTRIRYGIQSPAPEQVATVKVDGPLNIETDKPEEINVHLTHEGAKIIGKVIAKNEKPIGFLQEEAIKNAQSFTAMANGDPKSAGPIKRMKRYSVTAIRYPEIGEFYYDQKFNQIDWRTAEGDEVSMSPTGWKLLLQDLPEIFEALGVNV